jgi:polyferredoxin
MQANRSQFNRNLMILLVVLYLLTIAAFSYANWVAESGNMQWWMMLLNIPILSIPLLLLYGAIYVLIVAWREHVAKRQVFYIGGKL